MNFDQAFFVVVGAEGAYVNDPADPGGETNWGISKRSYPTVDIKNLSLASAKLIYLTDFWMKCACDDLPDDWRLLIFDTAVNMGVKTSIKILQKATGQTQDGIIGPKTIGAAHSAPIEAFDDYATERALRYAGLGTFQHFGRGWYRRLFKMFRLSVGA
jgi:lysozyme family protein